MIRLFAKLHKIGISPIKPRFFTVLVVVAFSLASVNCSGLTVGGGTLTYTETISTRTCYNSIGEKTLSYPYYLFGDLTYTINGQTYPLSPSGVAYWQAIPNCKLAGSPATDSLAYTTSTESCTITASPGPGSFSATGPSCIPFYSGYINPKYVVVDVIYAPPGSKSYVSYSNSSTVSNTQNVVNTASTSEKVSVSITESGSLFSFLSGSQTDSYSDTLTQQSQDTQSVTVSDTNTSVLQVYGPGSNDECDAVASDFVGLDHDCDTIRVWLNPVMLFTVGGGTVVWNGYGSSALDPVAPIHIDDVKVGCLNGALSQTSSVCSPFFGDATRTWAANENWPSGQGPGLTATDLANILAADPWGNCTPTSPIGSSACPTYTTPGFSLLPPHFYLSDQENVPYQQGGPQTTYTVSTTNSNMQGESSTTTHAQTYGVEDNFTGSAWLAGFKASVGVSQTLTTSNEVNDQTTTSNTTIGTANITGPACSGDPCNPSYPPSSPYFGEATQFDVFTDQFFGTFVFVPSDYE